MMGIRSAASAREIFHSAGWRVVFLMLFSIPLRMARAK
jgi:hypothetical protein